MKKYFIFIALVILLFSISSACADEIGDNSTVLDVDESSIDVEPVVLKDSGSDENTD